MSALIALVFGVGVCAFLPVLPSTALCLAVAAGALLCLGICRHDRGRGALLCLCVASLGVAYATWRAELRLAQALPAPWQQQPIALVGTVRGLPDPGRYGVRLVLEVERTLTPGVTLPGKVQLHDYRQQSWPPGSRWQLSARFKQRHGTANAFGFDAEQWLWSEGLLANGSVAKGRQSLPPRQDLMAWVDRWRGAQVARIERVLGVGRESALIAALSVGAQQRVAREDWQLFAATGLTHLVSISGLHITMLAGLSAALAARVLRRLPSPRLPPRLVCASLAFMVATGYALLAGFTVPTQRTLFMLGVLLLSLQLRRWWTPFQLWWLALALVLLLDPFSVLAPGVWLSFGLVAALLASAVARRKATQGWRAALIGQWAAGVCTLVPLAAMFGGFPLLSPLANAVAIPFVSALLTPLSLLAVALPWDGLLPLAAVLVRCFYRGVEWLAQAPGWAVPGLPWPVLALALLGTLWLIAPRGVPGRGLGALLMLPMLGYQPPTPEVGSFQATVLDVGQGLSVLLQTQRHSLLFDTGAGEAGRVLLPQLNGLAVRRLDTLILSHHDADHDAAAPSLLRQVAAGQILAGQPHSLPVLGLSGQACRQGQSWVWDGVRFDMLAPRADIAMREDNAHSCILRVASRQHALLISGDAPLAVEQALAAQPGLRLTSSVLVAGHHGSKTSTGDDWLAALQPRYAVISAGYLNRYRHPHPQVLQRLQQRQIRVLRTDHDGALTLKFGQQLQVSCLRQSQARYWRARGACGAATAD